jgi:hypothetical protein
MQKRIDALEMKVNVLQAAGANKKLSEQTDIEIIRKKE